MYGGREGLFFGVWRLKAEQLRLGFLVFGRTLTARRTSLESIWFSTNAYLLCADREPREIWRKMEHTIPLSTLILAMLSIAIIPTASNVGQHLRLKPGPVILGAVLAIVGVEVAMLIGNIFFDIIGLTGEILHLAKMWLAAVVATDPAGVSYVVGLLKKKLSELAKNVGMVLETESLLNDPYGLWKLALAMGLQESAMHELTASIIPIIGIVTVGALVAFFTRNTAIARSIHWVVAVILVIIGVQNHYALMTMAAVGTILAGFVVEWITGHGEQEHPLFERFEENFSLGLLTIAALVCGSIIVFTAFTHMPQFLGIFAGIAVRLLPRSLGVGFFFPTWRTYTTGGSLAFGVICVATLLFGEFGFGSLSGFMAWTAIGTWMSLLDIKSFIRLGQTTA